MMIIGNYELTLLYDIDINILEEKFKLEMD